MLRSMKGLTGFTIGATDGDIGRVDACYFDDASFTVRHLVVDTGGWLGGRKVLISPMALRDIDWDGKRITAALTKAQVEKSPAIAEGRHSPLGGFPLGLTSISRPIAQAGHVAAMLVPCGVGVYISRQSMASWPVDDDEARTASGNGGRPRASTARRSGQATTAG